MKTYPESSRARVLHHVIVLVFVTHRIGKNTIFADDASASKILRKPQPVALKSISSVSPAVVDAVVVVLVISVISGFSLAVFGWRHDGRASTAGVTGTAPSTKAILIAAPADTAAPAALVGKATFHVVAPMGLVLLAVVVTASAVHLLTPLLALAMPTRRQTVRAA